jgi:hypothetical protein
VLGRPFVFRQTEQDNVQLSVAWGHSNVLQAQLGWRKRPDYVLYDCALKRVTFDGAALETDNYRIHGGYFL